MIIKCPNCDSERRHTINISQNKNEVIREVSCSDCPAVYRVMFEPHRIEIVNNLSEEE